MAKAIYCDCGLVCRGETDDELLREAEGHLRRDHPALAGRVPAQDLLAMAVEVGGDVAATAPPPGTLVAVRRRAGVATVLLNRPSRRNALTLEMLQRLHAEITALSESPDVRAVVIAGAGSAFCAGHDLAEMRDGDAAAHRRLFAADTALMRLLRRMPQAVVAAVQGPASAAGCHLVAACDLAVAAEGASFAVPAPALGLPGTTAMVEIARVIGRRRALQMVLGGAPVSAETALAWGLVNAVVPPQELADAAEALARSVSAGAPGASALAKRTLDDVLEMDLAQAYAHAERVTVDALSGAEAREGIAAFLEKRRPVWPRAGREAP